MLDLADALRDLQDGHDALRRLGEATDFDEFRRAFEQTLGHIRSVQYKVGRAVETAARKEPGRPRLQAATQWWASETAVFRSDPLLTWVRDASGPSIREVGAGPAGATTIDDPDVDPRSKGERFDVHAALVDPPATHVGAPLSAADRTPSGVLVLALASCESLYGRAQNRWG